VNRVSVASLYVCASLLFCIVCSGAPEAVLPNASGSGMNATLVVSCLDDSLTHGLPYVGTQKTYPARPLVMLETVYGAGNVQVINHGATGYRADQVLDDLHNLDWMAEDPAVVLLLVGGNDLAQDIIGSGFNLPEVIAPTVTEVQGIVDVVTAHVNGNGSHPQIIVSAYIPNLIPSIGAFTGTEAVRQYNDSLETDLTGVDMWFIDNWDDFYDPDTDHAKPSLMSDLVHPNEEGYVVIADNWFEAIQALLARATPTHTPTATGTPTPTPTQTATCTVTAWQAYLPIVRK